MAEKWFQIYNKADGLSRGRPTPSEECAEQECDKEQFCAPIYIYTEAEHEAAQKAIAAHEAKRAMPEEWRAQAGTLIAAFARAVEACYGNASKETRLAYIDAQKALIDYISTPPAGMVLVPDTPVAYRVYFDDCQEFYDDPEDPGLIDRMTNHNAELTPLYEAKAPMIAAAKEPK